MPSTVVFSPDGKQIATGNVDQTIKLYDAETLKLQASWSAHGISVTGLAYSPDGSLLASSGGDQVARVWTVAKPGVAPIVLTGHNGTVSSVAFRKDNQHVATCGSDLTVKLWKLEGGVAKEVQSFRGHKDWITSVAFSKDGFYLVSSGVDKLIKISEITSREVPLVAEQSGSVVAVAVSPDGKFIASGAGDTTIKIWDRASGAEVCTLVGHTDYISALVFTNDSKQLISASRDDTLKAWDIAAAKEMPRLALQQQNWTLGNAAPLLCIPAGKNKLLVWEPGRQDSQKVTKINVFDPATGMKHFDFTDNNRQVQALSFSADGKTMASAAVDGTVRFFDMEKNGQLFPGGDWFFFEKDNQPGDIALSPDGSILAAGSSKGELKICKVMGKQVLHTIPAHDGRITCCLVSPDGKRIATVGNDDIVKLWDLAGGKELRRWNMQLPGDPQNRRGIVLTMNLAFTPDSRQLVTANANTTLFVLDLP